MSVSSSNLEGSIMYNATVSATPQSEQVHWVHQLLSAAAAVVAAAAVAAAEVQLRSVAVSPLRPAPRLQHLPLADLVAAPHPQRTPPHQTSADAHTHAGI